MTTTNDTDQSTGSSGAYEAFINLIKEWLRHLDVNIQIFIDMMGDEALPPSARTLAAGVLLYLRLPPIILSNKIKFLGLIDDVIVMIIGLVLLVPLLPPERLAYYRDKYEAVAEVDRYEQILRRALGFLWDRLVSFVANLDRRRYHKKSTEDVIDSEKLREALHDETMEFVVNLNLSPDAIDRGMSELPPPEKVIGLLGNGLDEMQKRDKKRKSSIFSNSLLKRLWPSGQNADDSVGEK